MYIRGLILGISIYGVDQNWNGWQTCHSVGLFEILYDTDSKLSGAYLIS